MLHQFDCSLFTFRNVSVTTGNLSSQKQRRPQTPDKTDKLLKDPFGSLVSLQDG